MKKRDKINGYLLLTLISASVVLYSCKDDVFNPEKVKAAYQDRFPVKDIDPSMDWKMTQQVSVNVSVHEDAGTDYTIRIYDSNPLTPQSSAKLLAEGTASNTMPFITTLDCPTTLENAFVCRIDAHSRNVVKYVSVENGQINATFGTPPTSTRAAWTRIVSIETYSPEKSEADIKALLSSAQEIKPTTDFQNGGIYKISKGNTYQNKISKGGLNSANPAIIIVEGKWSPKGNNMEVERGFEFYVLNGGEINIPKNHTLTLKESSRFIVYAGGMLGGKTEEGNGGNIELTNASEGNYNYNAGTLNVDLFHVSEKGVFYNCGSTVVKDMQFDSGCRFINQFKADIGSTHPSITIDNGCYIYAKKFVGQLNMGDNSSAEIELLGDKSNNYNTQITMGGVTMLNALDAELAQARFIGPDKQSAQSALVKILNIKNIGDFTSKGNIYYEVEMINSDITSDIYWQAKFLDAIKNTDGTISKWFESPVFIPVGDCTGKGNTPIESGSETPVNPVPYTYVFEDNYPKVGDYDFNDIVLDITSSYLREAKTNNIKSIQLDVTLTAAGASKALGVGLRIVGINKSDIKAITTGLDDKRFQESFTDQNNRFSYNSGNHLEDSDPNVVIPIAGEVHRVFGVELGKMVNTGGSTTAKPYTYRINIELTNQTKTTPLFSKDNLDFFICYQYQNMPKRMEVHLYEFWKHGATAAGTIQQENLDLAGNNTWAICVPNGFRYPKEIINISRTDDPQAGAYPDFIHWARNHSTYQDWYSRPVENNTYR